MYWYLAKWLSTYRCFDLPGFSAAAPIEDWYYLQLILGSMSFLLAPLSVLEEDSGRDGEGES